MLTIYTNYILGMCEYDIELHSIVGLDKTCYTLISVISVYDEYDGRLIIRSRNEYFGGTDSVDR